MHLFVLLRIQEEREERHKFKGVLQKTIEDPEIKSNTKIKFRNFCIIM